MVATRKQGFKWRNNMKNLKNALFVSLLLSQTCLHTTDNREYTGNQAIDAVLTQAYEARDAFKNSNAAVEFRNLVKEQDQEHNALINLSGDHLQTWDKEGQDAALQEIEHLKDEQRTLRDKAYADLMNTPEAQYAQQTETEAREAARPLYEEKIRQLQKALANSEAGKKHRALFDLQQLNSEERDAALKKIGLTEEEYASSLQNLRTNLIKTFEYESYENEVGIFGSDDYLQPGDLEPVDGASN